MAQASADTDYGMFDTPNANTMLNSFLLRSSPDLYYTPAQLSDTSLFQSHNRYLETHFTYTQPTPSLFIKLKGSAAKWLLDIELYAICTLQELYDISLIFFNEKSSFYCQTAIAQATARTVQQVANFKQPKNFKPTPYTLIPLNLQSITLL